MNETLDDARLRATEVQMRHALGLDGQTQAPRTEEQSTSSGPAPDRLTLHRPPRRFVKDGEVPVTMVRRPHAPEAVAGIAPTASNQLEAARQTIRSQAVATERAERALADAQATIRDLRTKLAHERMAKEEAYGALQRVEVERDAATHAVQTLRMEVATERVGKEKLGVELREAQEKRRAAEAMPPRPRGRPRKVVDAASVDPLALPRKRGRPRKVVVVAPVDPLAMPLPRKRGRPRKEVVVAPVDPLAMPRKRGRPRKVVAVTTEPPALPRKRGRPRKVQVTEQSTLDLPALDVATLGLPTGGLPTGGLPTGDLSARVARAAKGTEPKPVKWWVKGWQPKHGPRV
jgi:hypothetical protein